LGGCQRRLLCFVDLEKRTPAIHGFTLFPVIGFSVYVGVRVGVVGYDDFEVEESEPPLYA